MNRQEMVKDFFENRVHNKRPYWCTSNRCGCMGCVNGSYMSEYKPLWESLYEGEPYLTETDVFGYRMSNPNNDNEQQSYGYNSFTVDLKQNKF